MTSYGKLSAEVYNVDKPVGYSFGDIEFYEERLRNCQGKILEPAAGTGRMLIPLLQKGFEVDGMDASQDMLALCRHNCQKHEVDPALVEASMQSFTMPERYGAVIIPGGSFLLMKKREDALKALKAFYDHLQQGGRLILDIVYPDRLDIGAVHHRSWSLSNEETITLDERLLEVDFINQRTISLFRFEKWRGVKWVDTELEYFHLKWYGISECEQLLADAGFQQITVSADYQFEKKPTKTSTTVTFEAVKQ